MFEDREVPVDPQKALQRVRESVSPAKLKGMAENHPGDIVAICAFVPADSEHRTRRVNDLEAGCRAADVKVDRDKPVLNHPQHIRDLLASIDKARAED